MCPSACATAGPSATRRTEHVRRQRTAIVSAPPSVATSRSPGRTPASTSAPPGSARMLSVPGCGLPGVPRSASSAGARASEAEQPALTPMSPPDGRPGRRPCSIGRGRRSRRYSRFVRRDQSALATERPGRRPSRLYPGCPLRDRAYAAPAVDRVEVRGPLDCRGDQQAAAEAADVVERDPVRKRARGKRDERPRLTARVDHDHAGRSHFERVDVVAAKGAVRTGHPPPARERQIRLRAGVRGVPAGPAREAAKRTRRLEQEELASCRNRQRAVMAGSTQVDDAWKMDEGNPVDERVCPSRLRRQQQRHARQRHSRSIWIRAGPPLAAQAVHHHAGL